MFALQPLESRLLLTSPGDVLTLANRYELVNDWSAPNASSLRALLDAGNMAGFDQALLDSMLARTAPKFFFASSDISGIASHINSVIGGSDTVQRGNWVLQHKFPRQAGSETYTVQLPANINWNQPPSGVGSDFLNSLNRQEFWLDLAWSARLTGNSAFTNELVTQLASWSAQNPPLANPDAWRDAFPRWQYLDSSIRAEMWVWSYATLLGASGWTKEANTLFLYKLRDHARYLHEVDPVDFTDNRAVSHGKALLYIGQYFPEFSRAGDWEALGREYLFKCLTSQFYPDGAHAEQSPGYTQAVLVDFLDARRIDELNGDSWGASQVSRLEKAVESYYQVLTPDGKRPAIGDTYRAAASTLWLQANLTLETSHYPAAKPRQRDAWVFGVSAISPFSSRPIHPALGERGKTFRMPNGGVHIFRSGSDANARQITFDVGPKGGQHGHFDLLGFELFGFGRALIADPGLFTYADTPERRNAISTAAHNTISVNNANHGALEGWDNPGFGVTRWDIRSDSAQVTGWHQAYGGQPGRPVLARSIWYDFNNTMLIVDWCEATAVNSVTQSFTLSGTASSIYSDGSIQSTSSSGNVRIAPLARTGQTFSRSATQISTTASLTEPAVRFTVSQTGSFVVFATLITTFDGSSPPATSAVFKSSPKAGSAFKITLTRNGVSRDLVFAQPAIQRLDSSATTLGSYSDLEYGPDGRLHLTWHDPQLRNLKYAVRDTAGKWSAAEIVDHRLDAGIYPSLAVDSRNGVGIAYTDGDNGDLEYAYFNGSEWSRSTVDWKGSTGHYPSLAFSRKDAPFISYYDRTKGDLKLAGPDNAKVGAWTITTIDSAGDVGRFSSLALDPARPTSTKWAIAYESTGNGTYKYAIQGKLAGGTQLGEYTIYVVDPSVPRLGGYVSLAFDQQHRPAISYYDSSNTALKLSRSSGPTGSLSFNPSFVVSAGAVGAYSNLFFDASNRANIFYFDRTNTLARRALQNGSGWSLSTLASGGREIHVARHNGSTAFTNLDGPTGVLRVEFL